jgi:hypothetical protein
MDHLFPIETESGRLDPASHVKECPAFACKFLFDLVTVEIIRDPRPTSG